MAESFDLAMLQSDWQAEIELAEKAHKRWEERGAKVVKRYADHARPCRLDHEMPSNYIQRGVTK